MCNYDPVYLKFGLIMIRLKITIKAQIISRASMRRRGGKESDDDGHGDEDCNIPPTNLPNSPKITLSIQ